MMLQTKPDQTIQFGGKKFFHLLIQPRHLKSGLGSYFLTPIHSVFIFVISVDNQKKKLPANQHQLVVSVSIFQDEIKQRSVVSWKEAKSQLRNTLVTRCLGRIYCEEARCSVTEQGCNN
ncbi:unnamed protein product [Lactuca virosa]|uniref:Uncharacterized protein n=1 Tax=Lactuca virosa TaxID=75947 RepID=A0AAU9PVC0_9ASTR|nr:unnamed protein product [Lactuca virosa]